MSCERDADKRPTSQRSGPLGWEQAGRREGRVRRFYRVANRSCALCAEYPTNQPTSRRRECAEYPTNQPPLGSVDFSGFEWIRPLWSLPTPPSAASSPHSINHTREWPRPDRYRHAFITPRTGLNPGEIGVETARVFDQRTETPPIEATAVSGGFEL